MKIETLLPLGKLDPGVRAADKPMDVCAIGTDATELEMLGYDGLVVEETKEDPYVVIALAAQATRTLGLATSVALAFPRSPTVTAMTAWTLQKLSQGRFVLGLGSQVRGHIRRRFGLEYHPPGPWMREYVVAVRCIWDCWQHGTALDHHGDRYQLNLMVPLFNPGPIDHPIIPIHVAAVNPYMCRVAGEVADGVRAHPVCTPKYIAEVMLPAVADGAARQNRDPHQVSMCMKPLVATAADGVTLEKRIETVRARIAFYASTPGYRAAFEVHGLGDLADRLSQYSRAQRWNEMEALIDDEVLNTYAVVGTYDEIGELLKARFGELVTHLEFGIPVDTDTDKEKLTSLLTELRSGV